MTHKVPLCYAVELNPDKRPETRPASVKGQPGGHNCHEIFALCQYRQYLPDQLPNKADLKKVMPRVDSLKQAHDERG